jgi:hypothetical protein
MEFCCSVCEYTSDKRRHVQRHIDKKNPCGLGIREIIEIPIKIKCSSCNKNFSTRETLKDHIRNKSCKYDEDINSIKKDFNTTKELIKKQQAQLDAFKLWISSVQ